LFTALAPCAEGLRAADNATPAFTAAPRAFEEMGPSGATSSMTLASHAVLGDIVATSANGVYARAAGADRFRSITTAQGAANIGAIASAGRGGNLYTTGYEYAYIYRIAENQWARLPAPAIEFGWLQDVTALPEADGETVFLAYNATRAEYAKGIQRGGDEGDTWSAFNDGLPSTRIRAVQASAADGGKLYAAIDGADQEEPLPPEVARLWVSAIDAPAWRALPLVLDPTYGNLGISDFTVSSTDADLIHACTLVCRYALDGLCMAYEDRPQPAKVVRSADGGRTWETLAELQGKSPCTIAASDDGTRIAAATETGVQLSLDSGRNWRDATPPQFARRRWKPTHLSFGAQGELWADGGVAGLLRLQDGDWADQSAGINALSVADVRVGVTPGVVLSASRGRQSHAMNRADEVELRALHRSLDGGTTWTTQLDARFNDIERDDAQAGRWIAAHVEEAAVYESLDDGATWAAIQDGGLQQPILRLYPDAELANRFYGLDEVPGVLVSDDGGKTWERRGDQRFAFETVARIPGEVPMLMAGAFSIVQDDPQRGIFRSFDDGRTWVAAQVQPQRPSDPGGNAAAIEHLLANPSQPNIVLAWGRGTAYRSQDAGATWARVADIDGLTDLLVNEPGVDNALRLFSFGRTARSADAGATWAADPNDRWVKNNADSWVVYVNGADVQGQRLLISTWNGVQREVLQGEAPACIFRDGFEADALGCAQ
jgi:photosystem II stability/assembly factor-like uncharacterized protein